MSGRAPQKPPRNARRIQIGSGIPDSKLIVDWMDANGFPFHIPEDAELYLSRDGRTLYGERFLVRNDRPYRYSRVPWWDYTIERDEPELVRRTFAYPIVRPLSRYAPDLAERLHLP